MERLVDQAIVLNTVDYGEADRVVTLFTQGHGRISAFAAGARKSRRRFAGALEPFTFLTARLVEGRGETFRLDGVDIQSSFHRIRAGLGPIARALYCVELCRELVREREPHPRLFDLLLRYLELLDAGEAGATSLIAFELEALAHAGFKPRFSPCSICGAAVGATARFDPLHGGVLCALCSRREPGSVSVNAALLSALSSLQDGAPVELGAADRAAARGLLNRFIACHLGRGLRSAEFMAQVGQD